MKKILLGIVICIFFLVVGILISIPLVNNYEASLVSKELAKIPLPPETQFVEAVYKAGKLVGNGNGMQYFGAILIKSELPLYEIDEYYLQYRKNDWSYIVEKQSGSEIKEVEHGKLEFNEIHDVNIIDTYYIVYSWGESDFPLADLDIRGH
ncbi:hypothetical protein [Tissierella sp.]|uniref:hypothetical protein n=1 Tax=Tissierella sp. TaxID=41274 RepID=UPI002863A201|nr:hypothetical protein [Tissierella sp.]MDR7855207.1 hypothetical protein [Tissierella sp.]